MLRRASSANWVDSKFFGVRERFFAGNRLQKLFSLLTTRVCSTRRGERERAERLVQFPAQLTTPHDPQNSGINGVQLGAGVIRNFRSQLSVRAGG
jgi:hypothetical protein